MCHSLFVTGQYTQYSTGETGSIYELEGRLNFIDSIDKYNHLHPRVFKEHKYAPRNFGLDYRKHLNVREKTFSKFLYFRSFISNELPTMLCEGKTDNIYLKSAINILAKEYPLLASVKDGKKPYNLLVNFYNYSKRTKFLLDLSGGGTSLKKFVERYKENLKFYKNTLPENPVILLLDNDSGPNDLLNLLTGKKSKNYPNCPSTKEDIRKTEYVHLLSNLYLILTPLSADKETQMEDFFDDSALKKLVDGRSFDPTKDADTTKTYGKNTFAVKVVKENKSNISFEAFKTILDRMNSVINHHKKMVSDANKK